MGWIGTQIGNYSMLIHDSIYDKVKKPHSKDFFEKCMVDVEFSNQKDKEHLKFPLTMFGTMRKINKYYQFEFDYNISLILFNELKKRKIVLYGNCELSIHCGKDNYGKDVWKTYYLNSPIGDENIKLSTIPNEYPLLSHDDFLWILRNGMNFVQKIEV
jgi:hypothetical protein